jgi:hypothetical protein
VRVRCFISTHCLEMNWLTYFGGDVVRSVRCEACDAWCGEDSDVQGWWVV